MVICCLLAVFVWPCQICSRQHCVVSFVERHILACFRCMIIESAGCVYMYVNLWRHNVFINVCVSVLGLWLLVYIHRHTHSSAHSTIHIYMYIKCTCIWRYKDI